MAGQPPVVVGAHYLPFVFLYGMWQYAALSAVLQSGGIVCGLYLPHDFAPAGWFTGAVLALFAGWAAFRPALKT